jgi:hypothetical protein
MIGRMLVLFVVYPVVDTFFLIESTLRLRRHGFPWRVAFSYSQNR